MRRATNPRACAVLAHVAVLLILLAPAACGDDDPTSTGGTGGTGASAGHGGFGGSGGQGAAGAGGQGGSLPISNVPQIEQGAAAALYVARNSTSADVLDQLLLSAVDADAGPQSLVWSVSSAPGHGTAVVAAGSPSSPGDSVTVTYQPNADYVGIDELVVTVDDGTGASDSIAVSVVVAATLYWVDQAHGSASDANPGSESAPWATIGRAASTLAAGETALVKSGTYNEEVEVSGSGTASQPIVLAAAPGATVTVDGAGLGSSPEGFRLDGAQSHIVIDGFIVTGFDESVYVLTGPHVGLVFRKLELHHNQRGMLLRDASDVVVSDCAFHHNQGEGFGATRCQQLRVERCHSHDNDDGLGASGDADGFHAEYCDEVLFVDSVAEDNSEDGFDLTANVILLRCVSRGHTACGVKAWRRLDDGYAPKRHRLLNCLVYDNTEAGLKASNGPDVEIYGSVLAHNGEEGVAFRDNDQGGAPDAIVSDTLMAWNGGPGLVVGASHSPAADFNAYWGNGQADTSETEPSSVFADPLVTDEAARNYRLTVGSPLRNAGADLSAAGLVDDFDGVARPQEGAYDIGAFELVPD